MSLVLPSLARKKRVLPRHGYEGRRAEALPLPKPPSLATPPVPSAEELEKAGISFEPVGFGAESPLRARRHGTPLGVFVNRAAAFGVMRTLGILALLVVSLVTLPVVARASDDREFFYGIAVVENTPRGRGAAGEQTPLQLHPLTIEQHAPGFRGELDPIQAMRIARRHLAWLRAQLVRRGVDPSPFNLALCWNAGLSKTLSGRAPVSSYDYARRVVAIMEANR
jgi:hypothetical protein